jgi:hypothetical protein
MGSLEFASTRRDSDPDIWQTYHMSISQHINKQKMLLQELVHMYKILQVLDIVGSYPNARIVHRLWYKGERFIQVGEPTTLERYICTYYIV